MVTQIGAAVHCAHNRFGSDSVHTKLLHLKCQLGHRDTALSQQGLVRSAVSQLLVLT